MGRVLVVDPDAEARDTIGRGLDLAGYAVRMATSADEALAHLSRQPVDVVVADYMLPDRGGRELLTSVRAFDRDLPFIMMAGGPSVEIVVDALKCGAYDFLAKPIISMDHLVALLASALCQRQLRPARWTAASDRVPGLVAANPAMCRSLDLVLRAAAADAPVLILGETGTGKEILAKAFHQQGPRGHKPFLAVNCSAIPETLLESQLFGHRRGAFTDAREDRLGLFQEAAGGTVFLDEIGDMSPPLQGKLLRVLQDGEVHALGAPAPVRVDVRVVAATHRHLESLVAEGRFRQDLFYRLNAITVQVPPLRERLDDLAPLVDHFLLKHGTLLNRPGRTLSAAAMAALERHTWPGNVRELENAVRRALVLSPDEVVDLCDLPDTLRQRAPSNGNGHASANRSLRDVERDHVLEALRAARGNKAAAARSLGVDRKTLYRKMLLHDIHSAAPARSQ